MEMEIIYKLYSAGDCINHALLIKRIIKRDSTGDVLYSRQAIICADSPEKLQRLHNQWYNMVKLTDSSNMHALHKGAAEITINWKR